MEWKNIPMCVYRHTWCFCLYPKPTGQKSGKGCHSDPVGSGAETQALVILSHSPVLVAAPADLWGTYGHEEAHNPPVTAQNPVSDGLFSKAEVRRSHDFAYKSTEVRKGIVWGRKVQLARSAAPAGWPLCPSPPRCSPARSSTNVVLQLPGQSWHSHLHLLSIKGVILLP